MTKTILNAVIFGFVLSCSCLLSSSADAGSKLAKASSEGTVQNSKSFGFATMGIKGPEIAGKIVPVEFDVTIGDCGLVKGGSVKARWEHWSPARYFDIVAVKLVCETKEAVFEVETFSKAEGSASWPPEPKPLAFVATLVEGPALRAGTKLKFSGSLSRYKWETPGEEISLTDFGSQNRVKNKGRFV